MAWSHMTEAAGALVMPCAVFMRVSHMLLACQWCLLHPVMHARTLAGAERVIGAAGGGMTVALSDTLLLCDMLRPLPDFSDSLATAATTHAFYTRRKPLSATINTLANALYQVRLHLRMCPLPRHCPRCSIWWCLSSFVPGRGAHMTPQDCNDCCLQ